MIRLLAFIARFLVLLVPYLLKIPRYLNFIWKWLKIIATNPIAWIAVSLAPVVDFLAEVFIGHGIGLSAFYNSMITSFLSKIMSVTINSNVQELYDALPAKVIEISCYLGVTAGLQLFFTGIVSAMTVLLTLKISLFLISLKIRRFGGR